MYHFRSVRLTQSSWSEHSSPGPSHPGVCQVVRQGCSASGMLAKFDFRRTYPLVYFRDDDPGPGHPQTLSELCALDTEVLKCKI